MNWAAGRCLVPTGCYLRGPEWRASTRRPNHLPAPFGEEIEKRLFPVGDKFDEAPSLVAHIVMSDDEAMPLEPFKVSEGRRRGHTSTLAERRDRDVSAVRFGYQQIEQHVPGRISEQRCS